MQKARRHTVRRHGAPTACRHTVSGSVTSPSRGSSHLSVALLSSLSVVREYLALRDGPRRFSRGFTCPDLLRYPLNNGDDSTAAYGTVTLCGRTFQNVLLVDRFVTPSKGPTTPRRKSPRFGLFRVRSPLLTESIFLSSPPVTEMFQFTGFATCAYGFSTSQFGNSGINARLSTPPDLSQTSTPFKAS